MDNTNPQTPVEQVTQAMQPTTTPEQAADQNPYPGDSGAPQSPDTSSAAPQQPQAPQQDMSKPPAQQQAAAQAPQQHPMVQKASILRQVAEALAGGPRYQTTIDPQSGKATRTPIPMSGRDIGMAIALEALSGAAAGAGARGPNATGLAAAAGLRQGEQIAQQRQEQQQTADNMASQDYNRQMQTFHNNLQMMQIAKQLGSADLETNQKVAAQYGGLYKEIQQHYGQYILGTGGEDDAAKYHATQNTAIPTGNVIPVYDPKTGKQATGPAGNPLWQLEYAFIDPSFKGDNLLTAEDKSVLAKYGTKGFVDSEGKPSKLPEQFQLSANMALALKHRATNLELADNTLQDYYKATGQDPKALAAHIGEDPTIADAVGKFVPLLNATDKDGRRLNYTEAIGQLGAKDPQAAGQVLNLLGGTAMVSKFDAEQASKAETQKKVDDKRAAYDGPLNDQLATSINDDPDATPEQKQRAAAFLKDNGNREVSLSGRKAAAEGAARTQAEIDTKKRNGIPIAGEGGGSSSNAVDFFQNDADLASTIKPENVGSDGINHAFLNTFTQKNQQLGSLVNEIIHGRNLTGRYGLAKKDGMMLDAAVAAASPSYNKNLAESYNKTIHDFGPSGSMGKALQNGGTAFDHLANLNDAVSAWTTVPSIKSLGDWVQSDKSGSFATSMANAPQELGSLYANGGAAHEGDVEAYRAAYSGPPSKVRSAIVQQAENAMDKIEEVANAYYSGVPNTFDKPQTFLSRKSAIAYHRITGKTVDPKLLHWSAPQGAPPAQGVPDGRPLLQHGQVVGVAQNGMWGPPPSFYDPKVQ